MLLAALSWKGKIRVRISRQTQTSYSLELEELPVPQWPSPDDGRHQRRVLRHLRPRPDATAGAELERKKKDQHKVR